MDALIAVLGDALDVLTRAKVVVAKDAMDALVHVKAPVPIAQDIAWEVAMVHVKENAQIVVRENIALNAVRNVG